MLSVFFKKLVTRTTQILFAVALAVVFFTPGIVAAQSVDVADDPFRLQSGEFSDTVNLGRLDLVTMIAKGIQIFLGILGIIAVLIVLYAGWMWMTSQGDEEKILAAKKILVNGVIGLAIILSSYAITAFVIGKLTDATGYTVVPSACEDIAYANANPQECDGVDQTGGDGFTCDSHPTLPRCLRDVFVVKSITPVTQNTGMNNVVIRAVFSGAVTSDAEDVMSIRKNGINITSDFAFNWVGSNTVLEARLKDSSLYGAGEYEVVILDTVRSIAGESLDDRANGVSFPVRAQFKIDSTGVRDEVKPLIQNIMINGAQRTSHVVRRGNTIGIESNVSDDHGVGLVHLAVRPLSASEYQDVSFDGPLVTDGSTATLENPFEYAGSLFIARNTSAPSRHMVRVAATDIDSNSTASDVEIVVVGEQCDALGESVNLANPDASCLAGEGGSCSEDWQCGSGMCDETTNRCVAYPVILDISPWNGAAGNMVTVIGKYFGNTPGSVYFGYDADSDGGIETTEWVLAASPSGECPDVSLWNNNWAIVKVPSDANIPLGVSTTIKIVRGDTPYYEDTTVDARGPRAGDSGFAGYFVKNTVSYPGLCSVKSVNGGATAARPEEMVIARGIGFGATSGEVTFAGQRGANISDWSNFSAQARIPQNLRPGLVPVRVKDRAGISSNAVPFTISEQSGEVLPLISFIDPAATTRQSFISIYGQRFGTSGEVWITPVEGEAVACASEPAGRKPERCVQITNGGFDFCSNYWSPTQVFAYVPANVAVGRYFVALKTQTGLVTDGKATMEVVDGAPRPSICSLSPSSGPAPLPNGHAGLELRGINFFVPGNAIEDNITTAYFWKKGASVNNPLDGTWLTSLPVSSLASTISRTGSNSTTIQTRIPVLSDGSSMQSGPIVIYAKGDGSGNLVVDHNMEARSVNWVFKPSGTSVTGALAEFIENFDAEHGTIARLSTPSFTDQGASMRQLVSNLVPGTDYTFRFSAQLNNGVNNQVRFSLIAADGVQILINPQAFSVTQGWGEYSATFRAVSESVWVTLEVPPISGQTGIVNIDNIFLYSAAMVPSNRAAYTVTDCRADSVNATTMNRSGFQCCTQGPETGIWKSDALACEGQTRDAGYAWRFTTGKLSNRPTVVEECNDVGDIYSPVPSTLYVSGKNACVNQMVVVRFDVDDATTAMVDGALNPNSAENTNNVGLFVCGKDDVFRSDSCEKKSVDLSSSLSLEGNVLTVYDASEDENNFEAGTWYRVVLGAQIQGLAQVKEAGVDRVQPVSLRPTRPCTQEGVSYAYCFEFKTSAFKEKCVLKDVGITPSEYATPILGRVSDVFGKAILFRVFGKGNQACTVMNVDGLGWNWEEKDAQVVEAIPESSPKEVNDSKAKADAKQVTTEVGSTISAFAWIKELFDGTGTAALVPAQSVSFDSGSLASARRLATIGVRAGGSAIRFITDDTGAGDSIVSVVTSTQTGWSPFQDSSFSLSFWVKTDTVVSTADSNVTLYEYVVPNSAEPYRDTAFSVMLESGNRVLVRLNYFSAGQNTFVDGVGSILSQIGLSTQEWHHIVVMSDRNSGALSLYIDGEKQSGTFTDVSNLSRTPSSLSPTSSVVIGRMSKFANRSNVLDIALDDLSTYNRVLNTRELQEISALSDGAIGGMRRVSATSTIIVNPGKPKVVDFWPRCSEACVNVGIGAAFNRPMVTSTYRTSGAFNIYRCADEQCSVSGLTRVPDTVVDMDDALSDTTHIVFNLVGDQLLATSTWYKVDISNKVRAYGGAGSNGGTILGDSLESFSWKFRTKSDGTLCVLSSASVRPLSFIANVVNQKTMYSAQASSAPDSCSPQGQILNPWHFDWEWKSASTSIATVSTVESGGSHYAWCTNTCIPKGSTIARVVDPTGTSVYPVCGNGVKDAGEDCDIALSGEVPGVSCSFSCLRPGNMSAGAAPGQCGNGVVEPAVGEECEINPTGSSVAFCSNTCQNKGSSTETTGSIESGICGSGAITAGEECELTDTGCTAQCLHVGTALSRAWCDANGYSTSLSNSPAVNACANAVSVCGNNIIESGEQCELRNGDVCSNSCLIVKSVCGTSLAECSSGTEGCSDQCTYLGASVTYTNPSVCGDLSSDASVTGKNMSCQVTDGSVVDKKGLPVQVVSAVGEGALASSAGQYQQTVISAAAQSTGVPAGVGDYYFQCGYTSYERAQVDDAGVRYNNCVDPTHGVGINSCCYPRPLRVSEYPVDGAADVCRNTYVEARIGGYIDKATLSQNVRLVSKHNTNDVSFCGSKGLSDVTNEYSDSSIFVATNVIAPLGVDATFIDRVWYSVRSFFARLVGLVAQADTQGYRLCAGTPVSGTVTYAGDGTYANTTSTIRLQIGAALSPETVYFVVLDGEGAGAIADMFGVGIKHKTKSALIDTWSFTTSKQICKLDSVVVEPAYELFTKPSEQKSFTAIGKGKDTQMIVPIPGVYAYDWMWLPNGNPLFDVPVAGSGENNTSTIAVASKNIEGELSIFAVAVVTADSDTTRENQLNDVFTGNARLTSVFCNNIWPPFGSDQWGPFENTVFHFKTYYCADAGVLGVTTDDLPMLRVNTFDAKDTQVSEVVPNSGTCSYANDFTWKDYRLTGGSASDISNTFGDVEPIATLVPTASRCTEKNDCESKRVSDIVGGQLCSITFSVCSNDATRLCTKDSHCKQGLSFQVPTCVPNNDVSGKTKRRCVVGPNAGAVCTADQECDEVIEPLSCANVRTELETIPGSISDEDVLQRYLMVSDKNDDAVGVQILENKENLSVSEWYTKRFGSSSGLQRVVVDGYEALTNGDTFYVGAYNDTVINSGSVASRRRLYNNIYVITVNQNAQANTRAVLEQIIKNWKFNTNIADSQYCLDERDNETFTNVACTTDFDCRDAGGAARTGLSGVCGNSRTKLFHDLKRLQDVSAFQRAIEQYRVEHAGTVPALAAGTYYPSYTNSMWPSWQGTLGSSDVLAAALPRDPVNRWTQCGSEGINSQTCWNQISSTYACPAFMQVYEYKQQSTSTYTLYTQFEYFNDTIKNADGTKPFVQTFINTSFVSSTPWCTGIIKSPFGAQCGDGIVQSGEVCELGQKRNNSCGDVDADGVVQNAGVQSQVCASDCSRFENVGECRLAQVCGNGIVEGGEVCDDGDLNGTYGQCNVSCSGSFAEYCGNNRLDVGEYCDTVTRDISTPLVVLRDQPVCTYIPGAPTRSLSSATTACEPYSVERDGYGSCSYDCQSAGSYCGDGVVDLQFGEQCDDKNTNATDGCDDVCKRVTASPTVQRDENAPYCGDGVRDWNDENGNLTKEEGENWIESCDTGVEVGKMPNAASIPYGEVRTYCSIDCQDILTVDAIARCGNGRRDFTDVDGDKMKDDGETWTEACDTSGASTTIAYNIDGSVAYVNQCTDRGVRSCTNNCQTYVNNCVSCNINADPSASGNYATARVSVLNPMLRTAQSTGAFDWKSGIMAKLQRNNGASPFEIAGVLSGVDNFMSPFSVGSPVRLMADTACSEEYMIHFTGLSNTDYLQTSDAFAYRVSGERGEIKNEYVTSPAVPTGVYRIVVRWTDVEENSTVQFVGGVYSEAFPTPASFSYVSLPARDDWSMRCESVINNSTLYPNYWWPNTSVCYGMPDNIHKVVYTHPIIGLEKTFIQSMTVDTNEMIETNDEDIAFFVQAVRATNNVGVISEFKNSGVVVDVYTAHDGQNPVYSIFAPTVSSSIKYAARSENPDAQYWHVFNLVKVGGVYQIRPPKESMPAGVIVTDMEQIRKRMPQDSFYNPSY
jgi:cysteine-rich repeat protein